MVAFSNPITGGQGALVRPAIKSPNFLTGVSGWSIKKDGSAEFNNVVIRGTTGNAVEIGPSTGSQVIIRTSGGAGVIEFPTHSPSEATTGRIISSRINPGAANENIVLQFRGPAVDGATDFVTLGLFSQNDDGTSEASMTLQHSVSGTLLFANEERLSFSPTTTTAGSRYFRINAPSGASASAELIEAQVNGSDRFNVRTTGSTTITQVGNDAAVPLQIVAESTQTGDLLAIQTGINPILNLSATGDLTTDGTITASPSSTTSVGLLADLPAATTASLLSLRKNGTSQFTVDDTGVLTTYGNNTFQSWTPAFGGTGGATFSVITGLYERVGKIIFINLYAIVNGAGAGASPVTVDLPVNPSRSQRQSLLAYMDGLTGGSGTGTLTSLTSGSGVTFDRLRSGTNAVITGANLQVGATFSISGWYREA